MIPRACPMPRVGMARGTAGEADSSSVHRWWCMALGRGLRARGSGRRGRHCRCLGRWDAKVGWQR